jgi:DNA (cytosine-5)-methyltransferase 1
MPKSRKPVTFIDAFCGAGGLSLGMIANHFEPILAFDSDSTSVQTHTANIDGKCRQLDIYELNRELEQTGTFEGSRLQCDILVGGPPCQGFSVQRRGCDTDARNHLVIEFQKLICLTMPSVFLMENVGGLFGPRGEETLGSFNQKISESGYKAYPFKLNAVDFGVPQSRIRAFIIGLSDDIVFDGEMVELFSDFRVKRQITVREAIEDLMSKNREEVANHIADKLSRINLERIRSIKAGQSRIHLPPHLVLETHKRNNSHRHLDTYGRMHWDKPSATITARFDSFSRGKFGHPELDRSISLREGARIQTFPDDFEFVGNKVEVARQIGNAVPPTMASYLGAVLRKLLMDFHNSNADKLGSDHGITGHSRISA